MNQFSPEKIVEAQKASLETLAGLTSKAFDGFERLLELNLQTMRSTLAETREGMQRAFSVKDPQELMALQIELLQPVAEKSLSYRRHFLEIAASTRAEFDKVAEAHYEASKRGIQNLVESVGNAGPAGSDAVVAAVQTAINATNSLYESVQSTTKQAVQVAEDSLNTAADAAAKAVQHRPAQTSRPAAKS
ncbi:phasin family protein [Cupriavidus sp. D39]|uniref:phasin family protein n=1 Tax=Cupriavidus sp. D39 TaxID=2997877 RepID=UPI0022708530|nr:phasin family protein [Cupriavidus sp. D39]MCY0854141.1 phasin family protein [Cupriavidus sp. D39]